MSNAYMQAKAAIIRPLGGHELPERITPSFFKAICTGAVLTGFNNLDFYRLKEYLFDCDVRYRTATKHRIGKFVRTLHKTGATHYVFTHVDPEDIPLF